MGKQVYITTWVDKYVPTNLNKKFFVHFSKWEPNYYCRHIGTYDEDILFTMLSYAREEN